MLKRTIPLLLALVMVASLCACGGSEKEPTAPTASTPAAPSNSTPPAPAASTPEPEPEGPKLVTHTWTENKNYTICGVFALDVTYDYTGEESVTTLYVTNLGGTPFFGDEIGDVTEFVLR